MIQPKRLAARPRRSATSCTRACVAVGAACTVLRWSAGWPTANVRAIVGGSGIGDAGFDHLLINTVALASWIGLGWFCLVAALAVASRAPGVIGQLCRGIASRLAPRLLRRLVEAAIGISIVAGPLTAGSAFAIPAASAPPAASTSAASATPVAPNTVAPGRSVWLDRPTPPATAASTDQVPIQLDRPAAAFVAPSPRPMVVRTPAAPATLIAGSPHRDIGDRSAANSYVVRRGDALWDIAARHLGPSATAVDIAREWPRWYQANRGVIGNNPSLIRPGELLVPPR